MCAVVVFSFWLKQHIYSGKQRPSVVSLTFGEKWRTSKAKNVFAEPCTNKNLYLFYPKVGKIY